MNEINSNNFFAPGIFNEFSRVVKDVLSRIMGDIEEGKTKGKAIGGDYDYYSDDINMIPSYRKGYCHDILIGICYDKDNLENRLFECLDHASKQCFGENKEIYFITTQWNTPTINKLSGYMELLRHSGVRINLIHVTEKGFVLMPV